MQVGRAHPKLPKRQKFPSFGSLCENHFCCVYQNITVPTLMTFAFVIHCIDFFVEHLYYTNYMLKSTQNIFCNSLIINNLKNQQRVCEIIVNGIIPHKLLSSRACFRLYRNTKIQHKIQTFLKNKKISLSFVHLN